VKKPSVFEMICGMVILTVIGSVCYTFFHKEPKGLVTKRPAVVATATVKAPVETGVNSNEDEKEVQADQKSGTVTMVAVASKRQRLEELRKSIQTSTAR